MVARTCRATGETVLVPSRNRWSKVVRITGKTGKAGEGETVAARPVVAEKRVMPAEPRGLAAEAVFVKKGGRGEMTKTPISLQDLRRRLYVKAKSEPTWRFWGLYVHVCKRETLREAYRLAKANDGAPGIDGVTFAAVEAEGAEKFLDQLREELVEQTYRPQRARKVEIPKGGGKMRQLSIPTIRDRVVQGALKLILEPIFEADFQPGSFGYRPKKSAHAAIRRVSQAILEGKTYVIDFDLRSYFDTVRHHIVLEKVARRVDDETVMWLLKLLLDASGKQGVPQGGIMTPRTQKVTSSLSGGWCFGVSRVRIDGCRKGLYFYDICHAQAIRRKPSDSIAPGFCFSTWINFPMLSSNSRRIAPFRRVKPTVTSNVLSN